MLGSLVPCWSDCKLACGLLQLWHVASVVVAGHNQEPMHHNGDPALPKKEINRAREEWGENKREMLGAGEQGKFLLSIKHCFFFKPQVGFSPLSGCLRLW